MKAVLIINGVTIKLEGDDSCDVLKILNHLEEFNKKQTKPKIKRISKEGI